MVKLSSTHITDVVIFDAVQVKIVIDVDSDGLDPLGLGAQALDTLLRTVGPELTVVLSQYLQEHYPESV